MVSGNLNSSEGSTNNSLMGALNLSLDKTKLNVNYSEFSFSNSQYGLDNNSMNKTQMTTLNIEQGIGRTTNKISIMLMPNNQANMMTSENQETENPKLNYTLTAGTAINNSVEILDGKLNTTLNMGGGYSKMGSAESVKIEGGFSAYYNTNGFSLNVTDNCNISIPLPQKQEYEVSDIENTQFFVQGNGQNTSNPELNNSFNIAASKKIGNVNTTLSISDSRSKTFTSTNFGIQAEYQTKNCGTFALNYTNGIQEMNFGENSEQMINMGIAETPKKRSSITLKWQHSLAVPKKRLKKND